MLSSRKQIKEMIRNMENMKAKISVTVDRKIVEWIDEQVKTQRFRNRSHAVELALMRFIETERKR